MPPNIASVVLLVRQLRWYEHQLHHQRHYLRQRHRCAAGYLRLVLLANVWWPAPAAAHPAAGDGSAGSWDAWQLAGDVTGPLEFQHWVYPQGGTLYPRHPSGWEFLAVDGAAWVNRRFWRRQRLQRRINRPT